MFPPVYEILKSSSSVTDLVGLIETRIFGFGIAVKDCLNPYIVWSVPAGTPENTLSEPAEIDRQVVQVDCYSKTEKETKKLAAEVRNALEPYCYMTSFLANEREVETKLFRIGLQFEWLLDRDYVPPDVTIIDGPVLVTYTTAEPIGGNRIVYIDTDNLVHYASNDDIGITNVTLGVTKEAAGAGQPIVVQISGEMINPGWAFNKKVPLFLGKNGLFTESVPSYPDSLVSIIAAFTVDTNKIIIRFREPIVLI